MSHETIETKLDFFHVVTIENGTGIYLNLYNLLGSRKDIVKKYSIHNELAYQMVERFITQITEEIFEFQDELRISSEFTKKCKFELIDIFLYTATIMAEYVYSFNSKDIDLDYIYYEYNFHRLYYSERKSNIFPDITTEGKFSDLSSLPKRITNVKDLTASNVNLNLIYTLGEIRSKYLQRKYHKPLDYPDFLVSLSANKEAEIAEEAFSLLLKELLLMISYYIVADTNSGLEDPTAINKSHLGNTVDLHATVKNLNDLIIEKIFINGKYD